MSKNPYVHPDEKNNMLNRAGYDGYSFDEKDEDDEDMVQDEWMLFESYEPKLPDYTELIFVGNNAEYDLPEIVEMLESAKKADKYGKDAISTFNLSHDIVEFGRIDWSNYPNSRGMKDNMQNLLAECVVKAEKNSNPKDFSYLARAADVGEGEIYDRKVREYRGLLMSGEYMRLSDKVYDISLDLSDDMNKHDWESYVESIYNNDMQEIYKVDPKDIYGTDDPEEIRTQILERENMDVKTPNRELPWYITNEMEQAGIALDDDYTP